MKLRETSARKKYASIRLSVDNSADFFPIAQSNEDWFRIRKKSADLAYSDQELRETGVQNLKAYGENGIQ